MKSIFLRMGPFFLIIILAGLSVCLQADNWPSPKSIFRYMYHRPYDDGEFLEKYNNLKQKIVRTQDSMAFEYKRADPQEQKAIIKAARKYIFDRLTNHIFPAWYGTDFGLYGTTEVPRHGKIACGYLVTTTLKHAGFQFHKVNGQDSMAMQTSENIILNLVSDRAEIKRYSDKPISLLEKDIKKLGKGLYIVGMDLHVGFIANDGDSIKFFHVSYYMPQKALAEDLDGNNPLKNSRYRVVGKILDDEMVRKWLLKEEFPLTYNYFRNNRSTTPK